MKMLKEWSLPVPWGKIALISWGNPDGKKVLLVHGLQDSAATFIPLLEKLPEDYHYVGFDMPGNGRSDPFKPGMILSTLLGVVVIDKVVDHLQWKEFVYIGHSMGSSQGLFYNALYPNHVTKFIHLDPNPAMSVLLNYDPQFFYKIHYDDFFKNYEKYNGEERVYSKQEAVGAIMRNRHMDQAQAELILSRNLVQVGEDRYKLTWDKRAKVIVPPDYPVDFYYELFSKNIPPSLFVRALRFEGATPRAMEIIDNLITDLQRNNKNVQRLNIDALHDVHFTNPEMMSKELNTFIKTDFNVTSKL